MKGIQGTSNKTYRQLMGNGLRYEIPKFQRDYSWGTQQWDDLWLDINVIIKNPDEEEHYMGYLVLQTNDNKLFRVIDGQQRITTFSILILAVLKAFKELIDKEIEIEDNTRRLKSFRDSYIGYLNPVTLISNNKLKLNRNSDDYYRNNMVLLKNLPLRNTNSSEKHMRDCFNWFHKKITNSFKSGRDLALFIDNIVDRLFFTVIEVTDQLNAFKVFETLNARGVQLSSADLLKNYLFSVVDTKNSSKNDIEELENLWSSIIGKLGNKKFEDYLRYFWNSFNKTVRKGNLFKTIKKSITETKDVFKLIRDLRDSADLYIAIQDPENDFWNENQRIRKPLRELKLFNIKQTNSLLMSGYNNLNDDQFFKLIKICSIISFRYNIIGGLNPNEQEDVYNKLAISINKSKSLNIESFRPVYINDNIFTTSFGTKQFKNNSRNHKIVKYILSKIEYYRYQNEIASSSDVYTIEHILPDSADESWGNFSDEQIDRCVYKLGNLTLLEKKLNREANTLPFEEKLSIFNKSNSKITNSISSHYFSWGEDQLIQRQSYLAKDSKSIWKVQELS